MSNEQVYGAAAALFGDTSDEMEAFCDAAADYLEARLKSGVSVSDCGSTFCTAAAMLAQAMKTDAESAGDVSSYTVGNVSVRSGGSSKNASDRLRHQAEAIIAPYCESDGFAFVGVRGC